MTNRFIESSFCKEDETYESPLRPARLFDFTGQERICEQLEILIGAAKIRGDVLGHLLFSGPPGLGKTTLSHIIADSMGTNIVVTSGPVIERPGDLAGILANLKEGDVLFIDEIHRMSRVVEEYLYPAMEDFQLDLIIDAGSNARSVKIKLNRFTLVGATTRMGLISAPLRSRFAINLRLDYYTPEVLEKILDRSSRILKVDFAQESLYEIAKRSRGTPRIANNLLRFVRDYAQVRAQGETQVSREVATSALEMLSVDQRGLDEMDMRLLSVLIDLYNGGPVGVQTLALACGEETHTIEEVHEPFLIMQGLLTRTPRGRMATDAAFAHLGKTKSYPEAKQ